MLLAWKRHAVVVACGYIVGFPGDTKASILRDVEILKRELPIDLIYLNYLTPLPGSEDHKTMRAAGVWMDPDFNKYDLNHRVAHHPLMSDEDWEEAYVEAHRTFYSFEHIDKIFKRMVALKNGMRFTTLYQLLAYREGPRLEARGLFRIRPRAHRPAQAAALRHEARKPLRLLPPLRLAPRAHGGAIPHDLRAPSPQPRQGLARLGKQYQYPYWDELLAPAAGTVDPLIEETRARSTPRARRRQEMRTRTDEPA